MEPDVLVHFLFRPKNEDEINLVEQLKKEIERKTMEEDVDPEYILYVSSEVSASSEERIVPLLMIRLMDYV